MSSKRGRKRDDSLPPNRARDVQRAFRARRAAHLQALEERVAELTEENDVLRRALNLPPSNRPPLGRGPTGKDKPKTHVPSGSSSQPLYLPSSRESSTVESPGSRRGSLSPQVVDVSMSSQPMHVIDGHSSWSNDFLLNDEQHEETPRSSTTSSYQFIFVSERSPPTSTYTPHSDPLPSSSRVSTSNEIYLSNDSAYSHTSHRPMLTHSHIAQDFTSRIDSDTKEDESQQHSYTPSPFPVYSNPHRVQDDPGRPRPDLSVSYPPHRPYLADPHELPSSQNIPFLSYPPEGRQTSAMQHFPQAVFIRPSIECNFTPPPWSGGRSSPNATS